MKKKYSSIILLSTIFLGLTVQATYVSANNENIESVGGISQNTSTISESSSDSNLRSLSDSQAPTQSSTSFSSEKEEKSDASETKTSISSIITNEFGTFTMPRNRSDLDEASENHRRSPRSTPTNGILADRTDLPSKSFVDVSSNNGQLSVENFQKMKSYGVRGVVVKLTEGTTYTNPYASSQISNARSAGLKVSAYHFARYSNQHEAIAEANYFVQVAKNLGLGRDTIMVNDLEVNENAECTNNATAFLNQIHQLGYSKVRHYSSLSWFQYGQLDADQLGYKNIWVAAYPYTPTKNLYTNYNSWQWASDLVFPGINGHFDISADYSGDFVDANNSKTSDSTKMFRLYNPNSGEHFYTANITERDNVEKAGWKYEGIGWNAPTSGDPVYRMYNPNAGDHHFTLNSHERDNLKRCGWRDEGVSWYSDKRKIIPLYRAYNPNARTGSHNYTTNNTEQHNLIKHGWRDEGVAWYGQ